MSGRATDKETGLTPQQEAFCVALAKHGNATQAYRDAYPKQNLKPDALAVKACRLAATDKVGLRLSALRADLRERSGITLAEHLDTLESLREEAREARQLAAAITAEVSRGKVSGLYEGGLDADDAPPPKRIIVEIVNGRKQ